MVTPIMPLITPQRIELTILFSPCVATDRGCATGLLAPLGAAVRILRPAPPQTALATALWWLVFGFSDMPLGTAVPPGKAGRAEPCVTCRLGDHEIDVPARW